MSQVNRMIFTGKNTWKSKGTFLVQESIGQKQKWFSLKKLKNSNFKPVLCVLSSKKHYAKQGQIKKRGQWHCIQVPSSKRVMK